MADKKPQPQQPPQQPQKDTRDMTRNGSTVSGVSKGLADVLKDSGWKVKR